MKYSKNYIHHKIMKSFKGHAFRSPMIEVGCGTGETLGLISKKYDIKGIDLSDEAVASCVKNGLDAEKKDLFNVTGSFNSIVCVDVLEHVKDDRAFTEKLYKILKHGGKIFIMVPSGKMMNDDILFGHYRRYSKNSIVKLLEEGGFIIRSVEMFGFPIIYLTRLFMNFTCKLNVKGNINLKQQTLKSSYEGVFDRSIYARAYSRIYKIPLMAKLILRFLLLQDFFAKGNIGFSVVVVAEKA